MNRSAEPPHWLTPHRLALLPAYPDASPAACLAAMTEGGPAFLKFVLAQDIAPLWHHTLQQHGLLESLPPASGNALREARMVSAVGYLAQRKELERIDELFAAHHIAYAVMKGAHVRECVYPDPSLRASSDIDILISPSSRQHAARVLLDEGYSVDVTPKVISHEATFNRGLTDLDLHWHVMRPGRIRVDMTDDLLARRQRVNGTWGLSDTDTLFVMLTHPAFAKYVCSPNMGLGRVADFLLWIRQRNTDWPAVLHLLDNSGLKAAAWTMLNWYRLLAPPEMTATLDLWLDTLRPGPIRASYLRYWLTHDLPTRWIQRPLLVQLGFTLALHDRPKDALRVLHEHGQANKNRQRDISLLLGNDYSPNGPAACRAPG